MSSERPTETLTRRASATRLKSRLDRGIGHMGRCGRVGDGGADGAADKGGGEDDRADRGGGDPGERIEVRHVRSPCIWSSVAPRHRDGTSSIKQGPCQVAKVAEICEKCALFDPNTGLDFSQEMA